MRHPAVRIFGFKQGEVGACALCSTRYEDGEALSEITTAFATDHDVWNEVFLAGWEKFVENGYGEEELVAGPEYSWMGYSHYGS